MNETFFKDGFLTSTEAQNICNIAKEAVVSEHEKLSAVSFYDTEIASILSPEAFLKAQNGNKDIDWISQSLDKIGKYNALNAWLKEAIKDKENELAKIDSMGVDEMPGYIKLDPPIPPDSADTFYENDILEDFPNLEEYYTLQAQAAAIGKYIHDDGSIAKARKELVNKMSNPSIITGSGRETVIYKYSPSASHSAVEDLFMSLLAKHRAINASLNNIKAKIKEEINKKNLDAVYEYDKQNQEYNCKLKEYRAQHAAQLNKFNAYKISEREKISKIKITVPESLMSTYKEIKALITNN